MILADFYTLTETGIRFDRAQASRFAKEVANDFNPLHDTDAKIFCVPGDLLFSLALDRLGLSQHMKFTFSGMIDDQMVFFPQTDDSHIDILDENGKCCLNIERTGQISRDKALINALASGYVTFSGKTFPHILVPLMSAQGIMINPARPLVIYQSMEINLDHLDLNTPKLEPAGARLDVVGKKGTVYLDFNLIENGKPVGLGTKRMSLRGLQPFEEATMQRLIEEYDNHRQGYQRSAG